MKTKCNLITNAMQKRGQKQFKSNAKAAGRFLPRSLAHEPLVQTSAVEVCYVLFLDIIASGRSSSAEFVKLTEEPSVNATLAPRGRLGRGDEEGARPLGQESKTALSTLAPKRRPGRGAEEGAGSRGAKEGASDLWIQSRTRRSRRWLRAAPGPWRQGGRGRHLEP